MESWSNHFELDYKCKKDFIYVYFVFHHYYTGHVEPILKEQELRWKLNPDFKKKNNFFLSIAAWSAQRSGITFIHPLTFE